MKNTLTPLPEEILAWFAVSSRDLPWRRTYTPYHIWISEIMLQQTQMDRVVTYFTRWLERFPDIESVAAAPEQEILKFWEGLGYYSRARNILKTAGLLVRDFKGRLPENHNALLGLPGIGKYTAGAIMSLAFNREFAIVDANIERLFSRLFDIRQPVKNPESQKFIWQTASELIPTGQAREFNQALMELGALICTPNTPKCPDCPLERLCEAHRLGLVAERPVRPENSKKIIPVAMATGILKRNGKIFIQKRPATGVWANLWEFPGGRLERAESPAAALVREYKEETGFRVGKLQKIQVIKHSYTIYRVTLHCFFCSLLAGNPDNPELTAAQEYRWVHPAELAAFAFPAGHRSLVTSLLADGRL